MQKEINEDIQEQFFGRRYRGASISKIEGEESEIRCLMAFLKNRKNFLILLGEPGTGKTYIASAIVGAFYSKTFHIRYFTERTFLGKIREGFEKYTNFDYLQEAARLIECDMVILDDIGGTEGNEWREEVMMETIDMLYRNGTPAIFISNLRKDEFSRKMSKRIASRLFSKENLMIDLKDYHNYRTAED